jgi:hypothetical protein
MVIPEQCGAFYRAICAKARTKMAQLIKAVTACPWLHMRGTKIRSPLLIRPENLELCSCQNGRIMHPFSRRYQRFGGSHRGLGGPPNACRSWKLNKPKPFVKSAKSLILSVISKNSKLYTRTSSHSEKIATCAGGFVRCMGRGGPM